MMDSASMLSVARSSPLANKLTTSVRNTNLASTSNRAQQTTGHEVTTTDSYRQTVGSRPPTGYRSVGRASTARQKTGVSTLGVENQEIVCAVSESRGVAPVVGLAFINLDTGEAVLSQINDSQTYVKTIHKLAVFNPSEILIVSSAVSPKTKLLSIIEDNNDELGSRVQLVDRRYFAENIGLDYIDQLAFADDVESLKTAVSGNYYAVCCFCAALKFIEIALMKTFQPHSLRIRYEPSEGSMMIDLATIRSLELVQNLHNPKSRDCLFGLLNETVTSMGARLLRSNLLQPLTSVYTLVGRYEAVDELSTKEETFFAVRSALKPFLDADKILTQIILIPRHPTIEHTEQAINNVIMLKHFTQLVGPVCESVAGSQSTILRQIRDICAPENLQAIQEMIDGVLNADTTYASKPLDLRNQRTFAVRSGVNGLLDVARQTYNESMNDALNHITALAEEHNLPLQTKYNNGRKFFMTLHASELESRNLPAVFINVFRRRDIIECQTLDLLKINQKINNSHNEVLLMSNKTVQNLISDVRPHMSKLFKICEGVAMLDLLCSFAHAVTSREYVRPVIDVNSDTFAIHGARHPIREKIQTRTKFIPNDIYSTPQSRFQIITGCNMSGKSTYIRTVALVIVMAQLGSFVPASYASFPSPITQLFARISSDAADEHVEANISTFSAEMREAAHILRNVGSGAEAVSSSGSGGHTTTTSEYGTGSTSYSSDRSLVLIDELGRGTSTRDGLAIAIAISEALVQSRARVWFATHFRDLALILAERGGVVNLHLASRMSGSGGAAGGQNAEGPEEMKMLYRVSAGAAEASHYGLAMARLVPLPPDVLAHAEMVSRALEERTKRRKRLSSAVVTARKRRLLLNLKEQLVQARHGKLSDEDLAEWMRELQREFVERMTALDEEGEEEMGRREVDEDTSGTGGGLGADVEVVQSIEKDSSPIEAGEQRQRSMDDRAMRVDEEIISIHSSPSSSLSS